MINITIHTKMHLYCMHRKLLYIADNELGEFPVKAEKTVSVSFRVSPRFKQLLVGAAAHEKRSQTNMLEVLLERYCHDEKISEPRMSRSTFESKKND